MASANNIDGALLDFAEAIRLDPTLVEAYLNRGRLFIEEEELESALTDLDSAVELEPMSPNLFLNRGRIHVLVGNLDRATADLEQVLALTQEEVYVVTAKEMLAFIQ
jgi:tetratricopeptide (TPR) repeat protein